MSYRESHTSPEKGKTYSRTFQDLPYRKMIWEWEQETLIRLLDTYYAEYAQIEHLDFACGTGRILGLLEEQEKVQGAFGVDISESMLKIARKQVKKSKLLLGDITRENIFPTESFDLVTSFRFFLNAEWELKINAMKALSSILRVGGYLIFNIHMNERCSQDRILSLYSKIKGVTVGHNTMSISDVQNLVKIGNLEIVNTYHYGVIPILNESRMLLPYKIFQYLEMNLSRMPSMQQYSRYLIILCKKKELF